MYSINQETSNINKGSVKRTFDRLDKKYDKVERPMPPREKWCEYEQNS